MGAFICQQPNGKYCRFSSIMDCPSHWNMTKEDYIQVCMDRAKEEAEDVLENYLQPFEWVKESFIPNNMTQERFDEILRSMEVDSKQ